MKCYPANCSGRLGLFLCVAPFIVGALSLLAEPCRITVEIDTPRHPVSPMLYGIFFEDINCSADGGIYGELVRNRSFEDSTKPDHWTKICGPGATVDLAVDSSVPVSPGNPRSLKVVANTVGEARVGVANGGYWGMSLVKGAGYELTLFARANGAFTGPLRITLEGTQGTIYAEHNLSGLRSGWKKYSVLLTSEGTDPNARLAITTSTPGTFWLDMVSLFPKQTWKGRRNGLRPDLAGMLAELKPAFVRFPGGCWVEGDTMELAYRWKQTVGDTSERRTQHNIWQYKATHGVGYHEYLQMCEDLGAEPLFVINCGMSHREVVPMNKMGEFVQDALDAIEYANGPVTCLWGSVRARNGHPKPFNMKYIEVGNENGGAAYQERYALFYDAIKTNYPAMHIIANEWGGTPKNRPVEVVDEHYYSSPEFFINNAWKYDSYSRTGHKVYVGEYAVTQGCGQGNLRAAVGEAAFMTGMERNSDVVIMSSYAPLFANVNYKKWNPDLINFDSSRAYGLPSYYVQKMFSENRGDVVLWAHVQAPETKPPVRHGSVGVGTWLTKAEFKDIRVTRGAETLFSCNFAEGTNGWRMRRGQWSVQDGVLRQSSLSENVRAFAGDKSWNNYTYTLKAKKLEGAEGFLIPFLVTDEEAKCWWNIGGWGNVRHALEMDGIMGEGVAGKIETGRWYDIRIEVEDTGVRCYLDGKLIHDAAYPVTKSLYAAASLDKRNNEVILKVVNVSTEAQETEIQLKGVGIASKGQGIVLSSEHPEDENSLEQPRKVAPRNFAVLDCSGNVRHVFPANSVTVMRFGLK